MGHQTDMKLLYSSVLAGCALAQNYCNGNSDESIKCPDGPTTYQWCKAHFTDYVGQDSLQEPVNPGRIARAPRDNWQEEFERYAARLLDQDRPVVSNGERGMTNKDISETLLNYMQTLWPMDGWVIVVANANGYVPTADGNGKIGKKCDDYNGIDTGFDKQTCFDHWFTGCREKPLHGSSSKQCRNEIVLSTEKHRVAIGVQVNKRIEHMERVDHRHVMWWASHAEGCAENLCGNKCEHCASGVDPVCNEAVEQNCVACCNPLSSKPSDTEVRNQIRAKYGVAAKDLNLKNNLMRNMGAKLIWQNYRQALDKENIYINDDSCANWDTLITFCSDNKEPQNGGQWDDIAWEKVNIDDHYHTDYQQFEIGQGPDDWYGNNGAAQCITIYVTPFSH